MLRTLAVGRCRDEPTVRSSGPMVEPYRRRRIAGNRDGLSPACAGSDSWSISSGARLSRCARTAARADASPFDGVLTASASCGRPAFRGRRSRGPAAAPLVEAGAQALHQIGDFAARLRRAKVLQLGLGAGLGLGLDDGQQVLGVAVLVLLRLPGAGEPIINLAASSSSFLCSARCPGIPRSRSRAFDSHNRYRARRRTRCHSPGRRCYAVPASVRISR